MLHLDDFGRSCLRLRSPVSQVPSAFSPIRRPALTLLWVCAKDPQVLDLLASAHTGIAVINDFYDTAKSQRSIKQKNVVSKYYY